MCYRGKPHLRQSICGCRTVSIFDRMTSEVVVGHGAGWHGLLFVALEHGNQAQECKNGIVDETNIGGGGGTLCLECVNVQGWSTQTL